MDLHLDNSVAFVAGASAGLGRAVARELLREGCRVAICSRSRERIEQAGHELSEETRGDVLPICCDVTREDDIEAGIDATVERFGSLNILVTNAGGPPPGGVDDFDAEAWRSALELNLVSTINLTRHALPHIRRANSLEGGFGRILMITSLIAKQPISTLLLSDASRAGVQGFARGLAEEIGEEGITVNTILPGYTRTERLRNLAAAENRATGRSHEEIEAAWARHSALGRIGTEEEFGAAAAFLLSRRASYITGAALTVDGGAVKSTF